VLQQRLDVVILPNGLSMLARKAGGFDVQPLPELHQTRATNPSHPFGCASLYPAGTARPTTVCKGGPN